MTDKATGGPVDPERAYWIGEHGPEPLVVPEAGNVIDGSEVKVTINMEPNEELIRLMRRVIRVQEALGKPTIPEPRPAPTDTDWIKLEPVGVIRWKFVLGVIAAVAAIALITIAAIATGG